ncbi:MAG: Crp/Fnr family transcriptional regulator [Roseiflexaceae bacterium]
MLTAAQHQQAIPIVPFLHDPARPITKAFIQQTNLLRFPAGTTVFSEGDVCSAFTILASGHVRVFKIGETGREITLYRFARGESCILTASCILGDQQFPAIAVVEQAAEAFVIPHTIFQHWIGEYPEWRNYLFALLSRRLAGVMSVLDEVAFRRMDVRIAEFLLRQISPHQATLNLTHQQIAAELGTSREVVSRILADFAESHLVEVHRGAITILDTAGLQRRSNNAGW